MTDKTKDDEQDDSQLNSDDVAPKKSGSKTSDSDSAPASEDADTVSPSDAVISNDGSDVVTLAVDASRFNLKPFNCKGEGDEAAKEYDGRALPVLPLRGAVVMPNVVHNIVCGRKKSMAVCREGYKKGSPVIICSQKVENVEDPRFEDIMAVGVLANVVSLQFVAGNCVVIVRSAYRVRIDSFQNDPDVFWGTCHACLEDAVDEQDPDLAKSFASIKKGLLKLYKRAAKKASSQSPDADADALLANITVSSATLNAVIQRTPVAFIDRYSLLSADNIKDRALIFDAMVNRSKVANKVTDEVVEKTRNVVEKQQREFFMRQQIKVMQDMLGDEDDPGSDADRLRSRARDKKWPKSVADVFEAECRRLSRVQPQSPEYGIQLNYLDKLVSLPWGEFTPDTHDIDRARAILDRDHFGIQVVKDRILEHLAVLQLKNNMRSPILCLYGPPGVGKTSLGKSIAEALGRKYVRVSLGGMHDESEIRGHRRTYIGAMPGRIMQGLLRAGSSNPVFILDEIDKMKSEFQGDPQAALLEVLDPEQNAAFHDNFVDVDYDLSKVMFIATANDLSTVSKPLLDRMELVEVGGYIIEEKIKIASLFLLPKAMDEIGLEKGSVTLSDEVLAFIIDHYTRESGVRALDQQLHKLLRRVARKVVAKEDFDPSLSVDFVRSLLGKDIFNRDLYEGNEFVGVVTGLAWTSVGGEILFIETSICPSKTPKLNLTGNLGNVMKESAMIALEYLRAHSASIGIDSGFFDEHDVHVHVPEGAVPKDGPSAGITLLSSIASAATGRKVRAGVAMTGEMTLRGRVLPVGGIKEKILAAKRAGISEIVMCADNQKDVDDIAAEYLQGLSFHYVSRASEVLDYVLLPEEFSLFRRR